MKKISIYLKKIINTFLTPRVYNFIVTKKFYQNYSENYKKKNLLKKILKKIFYFYPN